MAPPSPYRQAPWHFSRPSIDHSSRALHDANIVEQTSYERQKLHIDINILSCDPKLYISLVGKLIQLQHTRFEISYAIDICSRFMAILQIPHLQAVKCIF